MRKGLVGVAIILVVSLIVTGLYLQQVLIALSWNQFRPRVELHLIVEHYRDSELLSMSTHPMTLTDYGKDACVDNALKDILYIGVSNDESAVDPGWTVLPNEITSSGLERGLGGYTDTGTGTWNGTKTFTATETVSCCLYGLYVNAYPGATLVAAEQQGAGNRKNLSPNDTLKVTVQGSVT